MKKIILSFLVLVGVFCSTSVKVLGANDTASLSLFATPVFVHQKTDLNNSSVLHPQYFRVGNTEKTFAHSEGQQKQMTHRLDESPNPLIVTSLVAETVYRLLTD